MRRAVAIAVVVLLQCGPSRGAEPVVLELFTSQGCSSCPPADALLRELAKEPGVIALAYHVDYWNRLGWRDPFSSRQWSERQGEYVRALKLDSAYTPQVVINGSRQMVGSTGFLIRSAIEQESKRKPEGRITLTVQNGEAVVRAESKKPAELIVVAYENGITTKITSGENAGRTQTNDAIVRRLVRAGTISGSAEKRVPLALTKSMGVAAFLQDPATHRILTAASRP
ncbi:MAG TPA: DUF1223 domain-containing protein [Thermoanaerobaculia bacterium]|nr:DUF1223 domain-containing protein [Thermoanaerobaculia bacterium]